MLAMDLSSMAKETTRVSEASDVLTLRLVADVGPGVLVHVFAGESRSEQICCVRSWITYLHSDFLAKIGGCRAHSG